MIDSLFGTEYAVEDIKVKQKKSVKDLVDLTTKKETETDINKVLKSKKISLEERLSIINERVLSILGKQKANVLVIKTKQDLHNYISDCIKIGRIAIDTETNNSLDPVTCKLMGPCFYAPGLKQAYVPINHRDHKTKERLPWQLTEQDVREELQRILDAKTMVVMHNGKFDYEVICCTCDIKIKPDWDTIIAARLMDENEKASLKELYIKYIDKTQKKYDIDNLFKGVAYADVDPDIFALYAATDSMMTDKIYEVVQLPYMTAPEQTKLYWLFKNVEMPIVIVTAEMEMRGVDIDMEYSERLKNKYYKQLEALDKKIDTRIDALEPLISAWKFTKEANAETKVYEPKKSKKSAAEIEAAFPFYDEEKGKRYKKGKARVNQLSGRISLSSPAQLAILFYDILKCPAVSKKNERGTGSNELKELEKKLGDEKELATMLSKAMDVFLNSAVTELSEEEEQPAQAKTETNDEFVEEDLESLFMDETEDVVLPEEDEEIAAANVLVNEQMTAEDIKALYDVAFPTAKILCKAILERRGLMKLITTYIDVIPALTKHWPDGRVRFHLNSLGTDTGRYSSGGKLKFMENDEAVTVSGINIQNIPSHNKDVRMLFRAKQDKAALEISEDNYYELKEISEIETVDGWKFGKDLAIGDKLPTNDGTVDVIKSIVYKDRTYLLYV